MRSTVARACLGAAQASNDAETSAFYLARATLALQALETETAESESRSPQSNARRWSAAQAGDAKP
jgi:hypothetical protein